MWRSFHHKRLAWLLLRPRTINQLKNFNDASITAERRGSRTLKLAADAGYGSRWVLGVPKSATWICCTEKLSRLLEATRKTNPDARCVVIVVLIKKMLHTQINHGTAIKFDFCTNAHGGLVVGAENEALVVEVERPPAK